MKREISTLVLALGFAATARDLTLSDALMVATERDPARRADDIAVESSGLSARLQDAAWRPSFGVQASYNRLSEMDQDGIVLPFPAALGGPRTIDIAPQILDQWSAVARVDQLVWDGHRSRNLSHASEFDGKGWEASATRTRRETVARVAAAYWNLAAAQAALESAKLALARADSQAVLTSAAFRQGTALEQDTLQARLRIRQIELSVEQAKASMETSQQTLGVAMGTSLSEPIRATDPLVAPREPDTKATTLRPEVAQARAQANSADAAIEASRANFQPMVSASAEYDFLSPNQRIVPARDRFDGSWRIGIGASWNLWRGGADDLGLRRAELASRQARLREVAAKDLVAQDLSRRTTEYRLAKRRREIGEASLPLARRDLELARIRAQAGTSLRLEAIDRASTLAQLEADLALALAQENIAALALVHARGEDASWK